MFATISADIVASTSLSVNETIGLKQRIESLFGLLKVSYPYLSGRALEEMSSLNKGTMSVQTSNKQLSAPLQTIALLTDAIFNDMTMRQSEVVYYKLLGFKEADIAKKLGISQASVNNASTATKWYCIEEAIKYFEQVNFEEYE